MARIKKKGLDYFPVNTDLLHNRIIRRILKREGDGALAVLLQTYCCIYAGEGYYVKVDADFYDDLADCLYQQEAEDAKRILLLAVEHGLFNQDLFQSEGILTSADIQRQFLFITKRRNVQLIKESYCLLTDEEKMEGETEKRTRSNTTRLSSGKEENVTRKADNATNDISVEPTNKSTEIPENGTKLPFLSTNKPINAEKVHFGTQSIAKHRKAKHSKAKQSSPLLRRPPEDVGGTERTDTRSVEEWYGQKLAALTLPNDGLRRNPDGLLLNLRMYGISLQEQYALMLKSNFGIIGHPVWKGFCTLRESRGKIRQPGRYLLSLC